MNNQEGPVMKYCFSLPGLTLLSTLLFYGDAGAAGISIDATTYTDSLEIGGELPINRHIIGYLEGLDYPGEWVEYHFTVTGFGTCSSVIIVRGAEDIEYHLQMTLTADISGEEQTADFYFTGSGCG